MIPVALDPLSARLAVAGNGLLALRRFLLLQKAGAAPVLFADAPLPDLAAAAGEALQPRLPDDKDLAGLHVLWVVDLPAEVAAALARRARVLRLLVNVEDVPALCDFHSVAEVRRGDLLLTVSTGGSAPGLAGSVRRRLEDCFAPDWAEHVDEVADLRAGWRQAGLGMAEISRRVDALVAERCWLSCPKPV